MNNKFSGCKPMLRFETFFKFWGKFSWGKKNPRDKLRARVRKKKRESEGKIKKKQYLIGITQE